MTDQRILVPTDLSDFGDAALDYAAVLRQPLAATITVLFADEPGYPMANPDLPLGTFGRTPEDKQTIVSRVREQVAKHVPQPPPDIRVESAFAATAILQAADAIKATLIVMGTHGRRGLRRLMLGSVTEHVLHETKTPVLAVRPGRKPKFETLLCPVNFTPVAADALDYAANLASRLGATLVVAYVDEAPGSGSRQELQASIRDWVEPRLRNRSKYRLMIGGGDAAAAVLEMADEMNADLLVVGAQHKRFRDTTVLGRTTERIVRFAPGAVLTVVRALAVSS